jgi:hypothetical protein
MGIASKKLSVARSRGLLFKPFRDCYRIKVDEDTFTELLDCR